MFTIWSLTFFLFGCYSVKAASHGGSNSTVAKPELNCKALSPQQKDHLVKEALDYQASDRFKRKIDEADLPLNQITDARHHAILKYLQTNIMTKGQSVLDLGCAAGALLKHMGKIYDTNFGGHSYFTGMELVPGWIDFAKSNQPMHDFFVADVTEFNKDVGRVFDVITMNDVMEHIMPERYGCLFRALFQYSKPGTVVYMHVPTSATQLKDTDQYFENVVPQNVLISGMACFGFELEGFEYDMHLHCGSAPAFGEGIPSYAKAKCRYAFQYPKYYHVIFRRPIHSEISSLLPACSS